MATASCSDSEGERATAAMACVDSEGEKHAANARTSAAAVEADTAGGEEEAETAPDETMMRLPQGCVDYILAWKLGPIQDPNEYYDWMTSDPLKCFSLEYIDESTAILRNLAESCRRHNARFVEFQAWARAEFEEKGCVEVDEAYIARRIMLRQAVTQEDWDAHMAKVADPGIAQWAFKLRN